MHLAATAQNGVAHVLNDTRQFVSADVRMGISQDVGRGTVLAEHVQNLLYRTAFLGTGIKLTVGVGPCATLAKTVVALAIYPLGLCYLRQVLLAFMHILATLQDDGAQPQFYQPQGSK